MYNDVETTEQESMYSTNSFNPGNPGGFDPNNPHIKIPGSNYFSPWDIWYNKTPLGDHKQPGYKFENGNSDPEAQSNSPYVLQVTPFVGLAYFDGFNDGVFNDYGINVNYPMIAFPHLFANNQEVGNLVQADPFFIQQNEMFHFNDKIAHLPEVSSSNLYQTGVDLQPGVTGGGFSFSSTPLQLAEIDFLLEYGKVFFYAVTVLENGVPIHNFIMHPEIDFGSGTSFYPANDLPANGGAQLLGTAPNGTTYPLFYVTDNSHINLPLQASNYDKNDPANNHCNAYEVVFNLGGIPMHRYPITAGSVPMTISLEMVQNPQEFWLSSSLDLTVN